MASDNINNTELAPGFVRYQHELPEWERISKAWNLLEKYSGIPPEQIEPHLRAIVRSQPRYLYPTWYSFIHSFIHESI